MSSQASSSPTLAASASPFQRLTSFRLRLDWELALYALFIGAGAALRFWDLGARAFHHDESLHAQYAWYLFHDGTYEHSAMMHGPLQFFGTAFSYVLFGVSDYTARILPAVAGTALIGLPFFLRRHLGRAGALAAAGLIAFSPTLLYFSRFARNDIYVGLWTLGLVICLWRYIEEGRHRYLYIAAGLLALSFATKEATFLNVAVLIAFLDLWIAQTLASQIRERYNLDPVAAPFVFLALAPFAWAIVALRPLLGERWRAPVAVGVHRIGAAVGGSVGGAVGVLLGAAASDVLGIDRVALGVAGGWLGVALGMALGSAVAWPARAALGVPGMPRAADFLLILGTLSLPQFAAAVQIPIEALGMKEADWPREMFTLNLGPLSGAEKVTREELTGFLTVSVLVGSTAFIGLRWNWRWWLIIGAVFYTVFGLLYTTFLTNPDGFGSGIWNSLDYWLEQQGEQRGGQPFFYYLVLLPAYEFLPLLFAFATAGVALAKAAFGANNPEGHFARIIFIIAGSLAILALVARAGGMSAAGTVLGLVGLALLAFSLRVNPFLRFLTFWMILSLFAYSVAGEKMPWLNVHLTLPVVILAAYALSQVWTLVQRADWRFRLPSYVAPLLAAALGAGAVAFATFGPTDATGSLARILLGVAALLGIIALATSLRGRAMAAVPVAALVGVLVLFSGRAAWMASFQEGNGADAREMLVYTQTTPDVPRVLDQIEEVREATGLGTDLPIVVDSRDAFSWPWSWYLRNYDNASFPNMGNGYEPTDSAVLLVNAANDAAVQPNLEGYGPGQRYGHRWWFPETYRAIERDNMLTMFTNFVASLADGDTWDTWWHYFRDHEPPQPKGSVDALAYFPEEFAVEEAVGREEPPKAPKADAEGRFTLGERGTGPGRFIQPTGLAVDSEGNLYVADSGNHRVQKFDSEGVFVAEVGSLGDGPGEFNEPWGVAVDNEGNVYVADTWNHRIQKFDRELHFLAQWGRPASDLSRAGPYDFWGPRDVAVDAEGNVWVVNTGASRVLKFASDGTSLAVLGEAGSEEGQFREPFSVAIAANNDVFVADAWNSRIQHFDSELNLVGQFPVPGWVPDDTDTKPYLALAPDGSIIATSPARHRVMRIGADGGILSILEGIGETALALPTGLALDDRDFLYISNTGLSQIRRIPLIDLPAPQP